MGDYQAAKLSDTLPSVADKKGLTGNAQDLPRRLVQVSLDWECHLGIAPSITSAISELDAAVLLVGMDERDYCSYGRLHTAVTKDVDFIYKNVCYQVTANRPSGKKGSAVTLVSQKTENKKPFGWHRLIWMLYDRSYILRKRGSSRLTSTERNSNSSPGCPRRI